MLHQVQAWASIGKACKLRHMLAVSMMNLPHWHVQSMTMASLDLFQSLQGLIGMQGLSYSLRFLPSLILISDVLDAATRFAAWLGQYHLKPRGGLSTEPQPHWLLCIVLAMK